MQIHGFLFTAGILLTVVYDKISKILSDGLSRNHCNTVHPNNLLISCSSLSSSITYSTCTLEKVENVIVFPVEISVNVA
jgi:hypothetical protein